MAKKSVIRSVFHGLLTALVSGRQMLAKEVVKEEPVDVTEELAAAALHPLPPALPPPPPRQPRLQFHIREGWGEPKPLSLPAPTYVPAAMAFGIVMVTLGIVTRWYFDAIGGVLILMAAYHWIIELLGQGDSPVDEAPTAGEMEEKR